MCGGDVKWAGSAGDGQQDGRNSERLGLGLGIVNLFVGPI